MGCQHSSALAFENVYPDQRDHKDIAHNRQGKTLLETPKLDPKACEESFSCQDHSVREKVAVDLVLDETRMQDERKGKAAKFAELAGDTEEVPFPQICRQDLISKGLLGCGGFGKVELVEHTASKETFALKTMSKAHLFIKKWENHVFDERNVQMMCNSPFIAKLYETYCKVFTLCGTLEYLAPDVFEEQGYTNAADWWSVGVAVYYLMAGQCPFINRCEIRSGFKRFKFPQSSRRL